MPVPSPFLSLWCSPAKHACLSSRRSPERGRSGTPICQPPKHLKRCPRSVSESARCNSGWGLQFSEKSQSNQRSGRRHKPAGPGAAPGTATIVPPCSSLRSSFVKKSRRSNTGWRIHLFCSRRPSLGRPPPRDTTSNEGNSGRAQAPANTNLACKH